jgi:hypothetical protein
MCLGELKHRVGPAKKNYTMGTCDHTKIIFHPLRSLAGFPARVIVLWQENVRGTRNASLASDCYNVVVDVVFKCLRQRSNGLDHVRYMMFTFIALRRIWYSWVNKFSYFLNPHAINVLLYRMKPRKHIHVKWFYIQNSICWSKKCLYCYHFSPWQICCIMVVNKDISCRYSSAPSIKHLSTTW